MRQPRTRPLGLMPPECSSADRLSSVRRTALAVSARAEGTGLFIPQSSDSPPSVQNPASAAVMSAASGALAR